MVFTNNPHNFRNSDVLSISGLSTTSSKIEGSYTVGISSNILTLSGVGSTSSGLGTAGVTGIVTTFKVTGNIGYPAIRENDILGIGLSKKVLTLIENYHVLELLERMVQWVPLTLYQQKYMNLKNLQ